LKKVFTFILIFLLTVPMISVLTPKVQAFSDPYILEVGISYEEYSVPLSGPITQTPEGHMRLWYYLYNPNSYSVDVILGASIEKGGTWYSDPSNDRTKTLRPGGSLSWPNRYFDVPSGVSAGSYNVIYAIWASDWSKQYDIETRNGWVNMVNSVSVQLSSSPSNVGTITWDSVTYSLPRTVQTTTRIHWSGLDNIHCTPPTGYEFDHWEYSGDVDTWDEYSQWTSVDVDGSGSLKAVFQPPPPIPPSLTLYSPSISDRTVTINGVATPGTAGTTITRIHWNWGDGYSEDHWFPASHTYSSYGDYTVTVTAYQSDGLHTTKTKSVHLPRGSISGRVTDSLTGSGISGASVSASGPSSGSDTTDSNGYYTISNLNPGSYQVTGSKSGYTPQTKSTTVYSDQTSTVNFQLQPTEHDLGILPKLQRKDTKMLCLEGCSLTGDYAWDIEHQSRGCLHDNWYCVRASISIINSYYGGHLSQDRISFYVIHERNHNTIPENDLGHGRGLYTDETLDALSWALNGATINHQSGKPTFSQIQSWINSGRPILRRDVSGTWHATVIDGYEDAGQKVHVINPWTGTESSVAYSTLDVYEVWIPPTGATARSDESSMSLDSDGDGVIDFDEINRFGTDPHNPDTDGDLIPDKQEIMSYTFLSDGSFDSGNSRKPDSDNDGLRCELDTDSDNGGVPDGLEDLNRNGRVDPGETDPLNPSDDPVKTPPVADFTYSPSNPTTSDTVNFYDASSDSDGTVVAWEWNFGDGWTSTQQNPTHKYDDDGTYTITLAVTDDDGLTDDVSKILTINLPPIQDLAEETTSDVTRSADVDGDGNPDFGWTSGYDISFVGQTLYIEINIQLVGDDPGDALRQQWEEGIEDIWSNSYDIVDGIYTYPIEVEVNWVDADPHHVVTVHSELGRANMLNWYTESHWGQEYQDEIAAHEAGHMLGLYDEYEGGALDPDTLFTTTDSLMADLGPTRSWHYEQILEWLETGSGRDLSLAQSPLPPYPFDDPIPDFHDAFMTIVHEILIDGQIFCVVIESNSTVFDFNFVQTSKEVDFDVTGLDSTIGFCNVTIPRALLYADPSDWIVLIDSAAISPIISENETHTILYFTYSHSNHHIQIIGTWVIGPEPSLAEIFEHLGFTNVAEAEVETFPAGLYEITLYAEFTGYCDEDELSFYEVGTSTYILILSGPDGGSGYVDPPLTRMSIADCQFGLSMFTPEGYRYYTETFKNPDYPEQHVKVYENLDDPGMFLIGFENLYATHTDRDYQDMVFSLKLKTPALPPVADFTWNPSIPKVDGSVTFNASASTPDGGTIVSYEWDFGDSQHVSGKIVTHSYTSAGNYLVTLNVTDSEGKWDIEQKEITVVQPYGPVASFAVSPATANIGENVKFDASSSTSGWNGTNTMLITEYRWDFGDGSTTTTSTPIIYHSYSTSGNHYVTLTVCALGATPETDMITHKVTVVPVPVGGYSYPINTRATAAPLISYFLIAAILASIFITIKRKKHRKNT
jgi:PKD repeat protein